MITKLDDAVIYSETSPKLTNGVLKSAETHQFRIFSVLWAVAVLFHLAHSSRFDQELDYALLTIAALYVVFNPSLKSLLILIVLQIFDHTFRMPMNPNHWIFMAFANLAILHALFYCIAKTKSVKVDEGTLYKTFAPVIRTSVIVLYFLAALHKLNFGFFAVATSCATFLLEAQNVNKLISVPTSVFAFNAYLTVVIEFLIPVLLLFARTRLYGILLGIVFHLVLAFSSYNAFFDFSAMIFAAYFLFLAPEFSNKIVSQIRLWRAKLRRFFQLDTFNPNGLIKITVTVLAFLAMLYIANKRLPHYQDFHLYFFWAPFGLMLLVFVVGLIIYEHKKKVHNTVSFKAAGRWFLIWPVIIFFNGITQYLGLKTENAYAMFSNLRTEGGISNHLFIPASMQIFDFQRDVVEIVSSSDSYLDSLATSKTLMVHFELKNFIQQHKPARIDYLLNGEPRSFVLSNASLSASENKNPYILYKLMKFRNFHKEEPQPCVH